MKKGTLLYLEETDGLEQHYSDFFLNTIRVNTVEEVQKFATKNSVIMFGGGQDICPALYGEERSHFSGANMIVKGRDEREKKIFAYATGEGLGVFGVCRGSQFLCALSGGKLVQHCENHATGERHAVISNKGKKIQVTSTHHQMMYPFGVEHELLAKSAPSLSKFYVLNDKVILEGLPYESEIVFFPKTKALAVQGHPEYMPVKEDFPQHMRKLFKEYLL